MKTPEPEEIKATRLNAGLTQTQSAKMIYITMRAWQRFEAGDRKMHPAFWDLFNLKINKTKGDA